MRALAQLVFTLMCPFVAGIICSTVAMIFRGVPSLLLPRSVIKVFSMVPEAVPVLVCSQHEAHRSSHPRDQPPRETRRRYRPSSSPSSPTRSIGWTNSLGITVRRAIASHFKRSACPARDRPLTISRVAPLPISPPARTRIPKPRRRRRATRLPTPRARRKSCVATSTPRGHQNLRRCLASETSLLERMCRGTWVEKICDHVRIAISAGLLVPRPVY